MKIFLTIKLRLNYCKKFSYRISSILNLGKMNIVI